MDNLKQNRAAKARYANDLRCIRGTFAVEGMTLSESARKNLDRIVSGRVSYRQVLCELRAKYKESDQ